MMKNVSIFLPLLLLFVCGACQSETATTQSSQSSSALEKPEIQSSKLNPEAFLAKLEQLGRTQLIDVRTPPELEGGFIPEAKNIDFRSSDFQTQISQLDKSQPVFVYCAKGGRSGRAANALQELGFTEIYDLVGGFTAWSQQGLETSQTKK